MTVRIGIIGCGNIAPAYLKTLRGTTAAEVVAVADLDPARAKARADEFGVKKACTVDELLADKGVDLAINLTIPKAHAAVSLKVIESGKHVYSEKPLGLDRADCARILEAARKKGVRVGCAPDTVLGAGIQTCRKLIDDGAIGAPVAATCFMMSHGPEGWHPDPEFVYDHGGGPMFDMGPYYVTGLVTLFGPIKRVSGATRITFPTRYVGSGPKKGKAMQVQVPTHVAATLEFDNGAIATLITSFDIWHSSLPNFEAHGTEGSLQVPDPNGFGGTVRVRRADDKDWREVAHTHPFADNSRGIGAIDIAQAVAENRPARASGELAAHVVDVMQAIHDSSREGRHVEIRSRCERPAAMPASATSKAT